MKTNQIAIPQLYTEGMEGHYGYEDFDTMCEDVNFNTAIAEVVDEMVMDIEK